MKRLLLWVCPHTRLCLSSLKRHTVSRLYIYILYLYYWGVCVWKKKPMLLFWKDGEEVVSLALMYVCSKSHRTRAITNVTSPESCVQAPGTSIRPLLPIFSPNQSMQPAVTSWGMWSGGDLPPSFAVPSLAPPPGWNDSLMLEVLWSSLQTFSREIVARLTVLNFERFQHPGRRVFPARPGRFHPKGTLVLRGNALL